MNWIRQFQLLREIQHSMDLMRLKLGEEEAGQALHVTRYFFHRILVSAASMFKP
jgi:hypothetical protein